MPTYLFELYEVNGQTVFGFSRPPLSFLIATVDGRSFKYGYAPSETAREEAEAKFTAWLDINRNKSDKELREMQNAPPQLAQ